MVVDDEAVAAPRGCFEAAIQCKSKPNQLGRTPVYTHTHTHTAAVVVVVVVYRAHS